MGLSTPELPSTALDPVTEFAEVLRRSAGGAESCLRGAADALPSLPVTPEAVGLKDAAVALLDAIDARPGPDARRRPQDHGPVGRGDR